MPRDEDGAEPLWRDDALECPSCAARFADAAAFDRHRRRARCLDPATLAEAGAPVFVETVSLAPPVWALRR